MIAVSDRFNSLARGDVRPLNWGVSISFLRDFSESIGFFTLDSSVLDGPDFLQDDTSDVVQEWDKYTYVDYTNRLMHMEWSQEEDPISGVFMGIADIVLNNYDDYFTPGSGSAVDGNLLPFRPVRLFAGFGDELVQVFIGITEGIPEIDDRTKTAKFHLIDFMQTIYNRDMTETVLLEDQRVDEILDVLLQQVGLDPSQYELDVASVTIPFFYVEKNTKFGQVANKLVEAELGRLYMDSRGIIRFKSRGRYDDSVVYSFSKNNMLEMKRHNDDTVINVVEITAKLRDVQDTQDVGQLGQALLVPANSTATVWIDTFDPITDADEPEYYTSSTTSYYKVNTQPDGSGDESTDVTLDSMDVFSKTVKLVFNNSSANPLYVNELKLFGTPARVIGEITVRETDEDSIEDFDERPYIIDNDFFGTTNDAQSRALILLDDFSTYRPAEEIEVKGNMALEVRDLIELFNQDRQEYTITKTINILDGRKYTQRLRIKQYNRRALFILDQSLLDSSDTLGP